LAVTLTPVGEGRLEVILNGETIFDRRATGAYPTLPDVRNMRTAVRERLSVVTVG
jgi:predicted Rdx family selenoprotein